MKQTRWCVIHGCLNQTQARGFCWKHLQRYYRHKDPIKVLVFIKKKGTRCRKCKGMRWQGTERLLCRSCYLQTLRKESAVFRKKYPNKSSTYSKAYSRRWYRRKKHFNDMAQNKMMTEGV